MAGVRAVSLSPITSCADPPGSRWFRPPFPDRLLSPVSFEITAHHWAEVRRRTQLPDELLTSKSWFILLICATTAHFHCIDVDFVETIAVLVTRIFASAVADGLVLIAPYRQTSVDAVLVGINHRAFDDDGRNDRLDRFLLHIGQHPKNDLAITLDQTQYRRLFLFQRATAASSSKPPAPPGPTFFWTGCPCAPRDDIDLVGLDGAFQRRLGDLGNETSAKMR